MLFVYQNMFMFLLCTILYVLVFCLGITLFTYTSKYIILIIGIMFSVFLTCYTLIVSFWMTICSLVSDKRRPSLRIFAVTYFRQQISHPIETGFSQIRCGKSNIIQRRSVCRGGCREHSLLNLKYFIQAVKFRWHTQKLLWPPNFSSFACGPLETWWGPLWVIWPTSRTTEHASPWTECGW